MLKFIHLLVLFVFLFGNNTALYAQKKYFTEDGYFLNGFDVTSYFNNNPTKGSSKFVYTYDGVKFLFASKNNLEEFKKSPQSFIPEYNGWCAYAMGKDGSLVEVNPKTYKIINNKLYLFYDFYFTNTKTLWNENEQKLLQNANTNWTKKYENKK